MVAALGLLLGGCGSSSDPSVAHLSSAGSTGSTSSGSGSSAGEGGPPSHQQLVAFAQCMRSHGVPDFPEPTEGHLELKGGPGKSGLDPGSASFEAASKQCRRLLPNGGKPSPQMQKQAEERALQFTACMRTHGIPNFPEPQFQGNGVRLTLRAGGPGAIDPRSPQFQAAQKACQQYFGPPGSKGSLQGPPPAGGGEGPRVAAP
jgi:hypothetical protein